MKLQHLPIAITLSGLLLSACAPAATTMKAQIPNRNYAECGAEPLRAFIGKKFSGDALMAALAQIGHGKFMFAGYDEVLPTIEKGTVIVIVAESYVGTVSDYHDKKILDVGCS